MKECAIKTVKTTQQIRITEKVTCDVCGKIIADKNNRYAEYWTLITSNDDWNYDNFEDNNNHFDLCSKDCVKERLNKYFDDCEHSNTQNFELSQETIKKNQQLFNEYRTKLIELVNIQSELY